MEPWLFLMALLVGGSLVAQRALKARHRRQLREARRRRRAEQARHWEELTGQRLGDDWRS